MRQSPARTSRARAQGSRPGAAPNPPFPEPGAGGILGPAGPGEGPPPPGRRSMGTQGKTRHPAAQSWQGWAAEARRGAVRLARRMGLSDPEDLAQEALARCLAAIRGGTVIERPGAWIEGSLKRLALEEHRRRLQPGPSGRRVEDPLEVAGISSPRPGPMEEASLREVPLLATRWLGSLPPPFREIAALQYLADRTRREVSAWLRAWRPVGEEEVRRLLTQTHAMLRALGTGENLTLRWRSAFTPKRNRWLTTPPPPVPTRWLCTMPAQAHRLVLDGPRSTT